MLRGTLFVQYLQEGAPIHRGSHQHAGLAEATVTVTRRDTLFGRA